MAVPSAPGLSYYAANGGCSDSNIFPVCYRVAFEFGDNRDLGALSPAGCKQFAQKSPGCFSVPMFQSPVDKPYGATAMKIFRVDPEQEGIGCEAGSLALGEGWNEPSSTKTFEARCPNPVPLTG